MKVISFNELLHKDFNVTNLIAINKTVKSGQTLHVFDESRTTSVFVHLKDCNIRYKTLQKEIFAEKGSIIYIPHTAKYDVTYISETGDNALAQLLAFEMHGYEDGKFVASNDIIKVCDSNNNVYKEQFDEVVRISDAPHFEPTSFKCILYSLITGISKSFNVKENKNRDTYIVMPAVEFIKNSDKIDITVNDLAKMSHISEGCLRKHFKKIYGKTPYEIINERKIKAAKELLGNSSYTINEIADILGYNDASYFSKVFKKTVGVSPLRYRSGFTV